MFFEYDSAIKDMNYLGSDGPHASIRESVPATAVCWVAAAVCLPLVAISRLSEACLGKSRDSVRRTKMSTKRRRTFSRRCPCQGVDMAHISDAKVNPSKEIGRAEAGKAFNLVNGSKSGMNE